MMNKLLLITAFVCMNVVSFACGNEYGFSLQGKFVHSRYLYLTEDDKKFDVEYLKSRLAELDKKVKAGTADYKTWSDIALNLMKLGKSDSAIKILKPLAVKYPNEYNVIANLGTAYELIGKLDSAIKYIRLDLQINPKSHRGSEWVHVKILEAKIKEKKNPGWLNSHSVLDLNELISKVDTGDLHETFYPINNQITYQIITRAPFTPAPDKILSNIMVTLGDLNKRYGSYENALMAYSYAIQFESSDYISGTLYKRIKDLNIARDSIGKYKEIPFMFMRLIKLGELNPELLVMGLDSFAMQLDSAERKNYLHQDSIRILQNKIDSLKATSKKKGETKQEVSTNENNFNWIYILSALVLGSILTGLFLKLLPSVVKKFKNNQ